MIRRSLLIPVSFVLLTLCGASRGLATLSCNDCTCSSSCSLTCFDDFGSSTCGLHGVCSGSSGCGGGGGGCLTAGDPGTLLDLIQADPGQAPLTDHPGGRVLARLTWRLAQYVEENGLGSVYAGDTAFLLSKMTGRVGAPTLAFVSREHLQAGRSWSGAPDLAVELRTDSVRDWLQAGTRAVVVIDAAAHTVAVYRSRSKPQVFGSQDMLKLPGILPGWALRVGELFE